MEKEKILNIPNVLSFYRLITFPFILWMIYADKESLFAVFLCINLVTDILDGLIARVFKLQTKFGAKLDSLADNGTYILAFAGIYKYKLDILGSSVWMLWVFLSLFGLANLLSVIKFRKWPSLHLYTTKVGGYIQGIFFFVLFTWGHYPILYYLAMVSGYLSWIEEIIILLMLNKMKSDVKGLYWVMKTAKRH